MKRASLIPLVLMLAGGCLAAWGLFSPLVKFPVIGSYTFSQPDFGGSTWLAGLVAALFLLGAALHLAGPVFRRLGWICCGMGPGLLLGTLLVRRSWITDKLLQMADMSGQLDADVEALLAKMEISGGAWSLGAGLVLWAAGLVWRLVTAHR